MGQIKAILITAVQSGSLAAQYGIERGDRLLTVNGYHLRDLLDYRYLISSDQVNLRIYRKGVGLSLLTITKDADSDLGLAFGSDCFDGMKRCRNRCIFCFIDQLPQGLRHSLYLKDDDFRLSFLHGNFITLTNLSPAELERIATFKYSPIYLSVHTTDPELRGLMLGRRQPAPVLEQIATLVESGIRLQIQIVLCPGINDGRELEQTLDDLTYYYPGVHSVGIVPVGLTRFRDELPRLRNFTRPESRRVITAVSHLQLEYRRRWGRSLVYLADEFYLRAKRPLPPCSSYDDFPQLENGIGIARQLRHEFHGLLPQLPERLQKARSYLVATGKAGAQVLQPVISRLNLITNLELKLVTIPSTWFGPRVTVTGLLTGSDLLWGLRGKSGEQVLVPRLLLRDGSDLFLDGMTLKEVETRTGCSLKVIDPTATALVEEVTRHQ